MANQPKKYKKFVATAATATLVASAIVPVASAASLSDIAGNTHEEAINALVDAKVISGYPDGTFKPNKTLTRSDVVKLLGKYLVSQGHSIPTDAVSNPRFSDLTSKSNKELLEYAAVVADAGVFAGSNGKLLAGDQITRENMAIVLVRMINTLKDVSLEEFVASQNFNGDVKDLNVAKAEARTAIQVLDFYDITNPSVANFNPKGNTTRGQFATFLHKTINSDFAGAAATTGTVKAINNTTVEVTFAEEVKDLASLNFAIEGLTVAGKVVKQTDKKTVVLTTSAQTKDTEYTVTVNGDTVGKFVGLAEVIPTKVTTTTTSVQGVIGEQVTVKAQVTVAEGQSKLNVPVTFNILNSNNANEKIEAQALTNADGVAEYTYTRYYGSEDTVTAYATKKSSVYDQAKVYWANKIQLSVTEVNEGTELANEAKKSFKVNGAANTTYYIAIKENLGVTADKVTQVKVQDSTGGFVTPYETTSGSTSFAKVTTNSNGEAAFSIYGSNLSATPIVYAPQSTPTTPATFTYNKLDLQAVAKTIAFKQIDSLQVAVAGVGTEKAARYAVAPTSGDSHSAGGRYYTTTVTKKDGSVVPAGTVAYVTFKDGDVSGDVYITSGAAANFAKVEADKVYRLVVGKEGKVTFRVMGAPTSTTNLAYAKPTVFLNTAGDLDANETSTSLNTTGSNVKLNTADVQQTGETTYFEAAVVANAELEVTDSLGRAVTTSSTTDDVYFRYQSVDQNGFAYRPTATTVGGEYTIYVPVYAADGTTIIGYRTETRTDAQQIVRPFKLAFDVTSSTGQVDVYQGNSNVPLVGSGQNTSRTKTYEIQSDVNGVAVIRVKAALTTNVSVNVTGSNSILPTKSASVQFVKAGTLPNVYQNAVEEFNTVDGTITFLGQSAVSMKPAGAIYKKNGVALPGGYASFASELEAVAAHNVANAGTASDQGVIVKRSVDNDGIVTYDIIEVSTSVATKITNATPSNTALQTAITNLNNAVAPVKAADYIVADRAAVQEAIDAANSVLFGGSTTAQDYVNALNTFNSAIAGKTKTSVATEVTNAANALTVPGTFTGLTGTTALPTTTTPDGFTISWSEKTDASNVATLTGNSLSVTQSAADNTDDTVVLTATVTNGTYTATKDLTFTVKEGLAPAAPTATLDTNTIVLAGEAGATIKYKVGAAATTLADVLATGTAYTTALTDTAVANNDFISIVVTDAAGNSTLAVYKVTEAVAGTITDVTVAP